MNTAKPALSKAHITEVIRYSVLVLVSLVFEGYARVWYPEGSHLLGQRLSEYYGNGVLVLLFLVLYAQPLKLLHHRRALGIAACAWSVVHTVYAFEHVLGGRWLGILFLFPAKQFSIGLGGVALLLLLAMALTSHSRAVQWLGKKWKKLHRLVWLVWFLAVLHTLLIGVHYASWLGVGLGILLGFSFYFRFNRVVWNKKSN